MRPSSLLLLQPPPRLLLLPVVLAAVVLLLCASARAQDLGVYYLQRQFPTPVTLFNASAAPVAGVNGTVRADNVSNVDNTPLFHVPLGFAFPFFGQVYSQVYVSPNGFVQFTPVPSCGSGMGDGTCDHSVSLAGLVDDYNPAESSVNDTGIFYMPIEHPTEGDAGLRVVYWHVPFKKNPEGRKNIMAIDLYESGQMDTHLGDIKVRAVGLDTYVGMRPDASVARWRYSDDQETNWESWKNQVAGIAPRKSRAKDGLTYRACPLSTDICVRPANGHRDGSAVAGRNLTITFLWSTCAEEFDVLCRFSKSGPNTWPFSSVLAQLLTVVKRNVSQQNTDDGAQRTHRFARFRCIVPPSPLDFIGEHILSLWFRPRGNTSAEWELIQTSHNLKFNYTTHTNVLDRQTYDTCKNGSDFQSRVDCPCTTTYRRTDTRARNDCSLCMEDFDKTNSTLSSCPGLLPYDSPDCEGKCGGTAVSDVDDNCCKADQVDCYGMCNGTATRAPLHNEIYDTCCSSREGSTLDCAGVCDGSASYDACNECTGGTTGLTPDTTGDTCPLNSTLSVDSLSSTYDLGNPENAPTILSIMIGSDSNVFYSVSITGSVLVAPTVVVGARGSGHIRANSNVTVELNVSFQEIFTLEQTSWTLKYAEIRVAHTEDALDVSPNVYDIPLYIAVSDCERISDTRVCMTAPGCMACEKTVGVRVLQELAAGSSAAALPTNHDTGRLARDAGFVFNSDRFPFEPPEEQISRVQELHELFTQHVEEIRDQPGAIPDLDMTMREPFVLHEEPPRRLSSMDFFSSSSTASTSDDAATSAGTVYLTLSHERTLHTIVGEDGGSFETEVATETQLLSDTVALSLQATGPAHRMRASAPRSSRERRSLLNVVIPVNVEMHSDDDIRTKCFDGFTTSVCTERDAAMPSTPFWQAVSSVLLVFLCTTAAHLVPQLQFL